MENQQKSERKPPLQHLAIIMDGNGRWARKRGLPRISGHQRGVQAVVQTVDECVKVGIRYLSLFAFSSENWGRPQKEIDALMELLLQFLSSQRQKMLDGGIRLRVIGDRTRLSESVCAAIAAAEAETATSETLTMVLALSYGGRDEILRAAKQLAGQAIRGEIDLQKIDNEKFSTYLDTAEIPEPDLLIRTSGERRISNFLLWQTAYAEFYFSEVFWPDFDAAELHKALADYQQRKRRFGLTDDQLDSDIDPQLEGDGPLNSAS